MHTRLRTQGHDPQRRAVKLEHTKVHFESVGQHIAEGVGLEPAPEGVIRLATDARPLSAHLPIATGVEFRRGIDYDRELLRNMPSTTSLLRWYGVIVKHEFVSDRAASLLGAVDANLCR